LNSFLIAVFVLKKTLNPNEHKFLNVNYSHIIILVVHRRSRNHL